MLLGSASVKPISTIARHWHDDSIDFSSGRGDDYVSSNAVQNRADEFRS